jgi:nanoRNase/pAp phosphatase (c-di-AMP/oligoRNAs hydrolase)
MVYFDTDTDGTTAYLQLKKAFPQIKGFPFDKKESGEEDLLSVMNEEVDTVIFLDIPFIRESILKQLGARRIIWIDHHPTNDTGLISDYGMKHFNPLDYDDHDTRPVSYWVYRMTGSSDFLFYAVLGSVADFFLLDILRSCHKQFPGRFALLFPKLSEAKREELFRFLSTAGELDPDYHRQRASWIQYLVYVGGMIRYKNFFDFLYKTDDDEEVITALRTIEKLDPESLVSEIREGKSPVFSRFHELQEAYESLREEALKRVSGEYIIYEYGGETGFTKTLSEELMYCQEGIEAVMVAYQKPSGETYHVSLRSAGRVKVNEIAEQATQGLDAQAGGHEFAAGGRVVAKDFPTFKERVNEAFSRESSKEGK